MKRLADFLTHHNSVPIALGFLFLASGTALAASPAVRDAIIGGASTEAISIDNRAITDAALDHFDANMTIATVTEDEQHYYVAYQYKTFNVEQAVWKDVSKDGVLTVVKSELKDDDLKAYVVEQLRQVVESDLAYLKRVQAVEIASNRNRPSVSADHRELTGFVIPTEDVLPPVPVPVPAIVPPITPAPPVEPPPQIPAVPLSPPPTPAPIEPEVTATSTTTDSVVAATSSAAVDPENTSTATTTESSAVSPADASATTTNATTTDSSL